MYTDHPTSFKGSLLHHVKVVSIGHGQKYKTSTH